MTKRRIHLIYGITLSILLAVAGVCLIAACIGIYRSGSHPFTPETVADAFHGIAIPVYLCIALMIGGFVLDGFYPTQEKKTVPEKQYPLILERLYKKLDLTAYTQEDRNAILRLQKGRHLHRFIARILLVLCSAVFLIYGMDPANFHQQDITNSMIKAMYLFVPCLAIPFGYSVFCAFYSRASIKKEIELVKKAISAGTEAPSQPAVPKKDTTRLITALRLCLFAVGIGIFLYGFFAGGTGDVLTKAINICTECVGLG